MAAKAGAQRPPDCCWTGDFALYLKSRICPRYFNSYTSCISIFTATIPIFLLNKSTIIATNSICACDRTAEGKVMLRASGPHRAINYDQFNSATFHYYNT